MKIVKGFFWGEGTPMIECSVHNKLFAFNIKWTRCSQYQLIDVDCGTVINTKDAKLFDFIELNIIQTVAHKIKYIGQINGGLIRYLRIRFLQISWLNYEQYEKNHYKKEEHSQQFSVQSVKITFKCFKYHKSIDNSNDSDLFILS